MQTPLRNLLSFKLQRNVPKADSQATRLLLTVGDEVYGYLEVQSDGCYLLRMHHRQDVGDYEDNCVVRRDWVHWYDIYVTDDDVPEVDMDFVTDLVLDEIAVSPWLMVPLGLTVEQQREALNERLARLHELADLQELGPSEQERLNKLNSMDLDGYYAALEALKR